MLCFALYIHTYYNAFLQYYDIINFFLISYSTRYQQLFSFFYFYIYRHPRSLYFFHVPHTKWSLLSDLKYISRYATLNGRFNQTFHHIVALRFLSNSVIAQEFDTYVWFVLPSIALSADHPDSWGMAPIVAFPNNLSSWTKFTEIKKYRRFQVWGYLIALKDSLTPLQCLPLPMNCCSLLAIPTTHGCWAVRAQSSPDRGKKTVSNLKTR